MESHFGKYNLKLVLHLSLFHFSYRFLCRASIFYFRSDFRTR